MNRESRFQADVDNQTDVKDVKNYLIGPVFPHITKADGDQYPEYEYNRKKPIGIL